METIAMEKRMAGRAARVQAASGSGPRQFSIAVLRFSRALFLPVLVFGLLLSGCSALRLSYGSADTLALVYLDRQLDLDRGQRELAHAALREFHAWHRAHELAIYRAQLESMRDALGREVTAGDVAGLHRFAHEAVLRAVDHGLPQIVAFARTLRPEQLAHLQAKLDRANRKYRAEHLEGDQAELHERRVDRVLDQMERWFGDFSPRQRARVSEWVAAVPLDRERRYHERLRHQGELFVLIGRPRQPDLPPGQARRLVMDYADEFFAAPAGDEARTETRAAGFEMVARIVDQTTPQQQATARKRIQGWIDDLSALMKKAG